MEHPEVQALVAELKFHRDNPPPEFANGEYAEAMVLIDVAARQFRYYEKQHRAKLDDETLSKEARQKAKDRAFTNCELAEMFEEFLERNRAVTP